MKDESSKKNKLSWSKSLVKRWFNLKSKDRDLFNAEHGVGNDCDGKWRNNCTEREARTIKKSKTEKSIKKNYSDRVWQGKVEFDSPLVTDVHEYRIFVATWNVGGRSPSKNLNLDDWLHASSPADIYVLGFQEIVPLNAGNVLGTEDSGPATKWLTLIRKTLNNIPEDSESDQYKVPSPIPDPLIELNSDFEVSKHKPSPFMMHRRSFQSFSRNMKLDKDIDDRRFSVCDPVSFGARPSDFEPSYRGAVSSDDENWCEDSTYPGSLSPIYNEAFTSMEDKDDSSGKRRFCLVVSKKMVGLFLTIWIRSDLRDNVKNLKVSCVGRGLMGYLGNKGSISVSMSLHRTSFCFICSHLTSGQKEGDELRRNSDVMEILRKTRFPRIHNIEDVKSPETILEHDRIIWLGDLNYRIALSYCSVKAHVEMHNWKTLFENDQLQIAQKHGHVFKGWNEGKIYFPPTYKYSNNSDRYAGDDMNQKGKRRTPAWCDRILWYGKGLRQLSYVRGETRFSDHRPVYSVFTAEVESINHCQVKKSTSCLSARIAVEELLPSSCGNPDLRKYGNTELSFF